MLSRKSVGEIKKDAPIYTADGSTLPNTPALKDGEILSVEAVKIEDRESQ